MLRSRRSQAHGGTARLVGAVLGERLALLAASIIVLGYALARAEGAPAAQPLWYGGVVDRADGEARALLTGNHRVWFWLFRDDNVASTALCSVPPRDTGFDQGRFRIDVSECAEAMRANSDLFVQIAVDDPSKPLPRGKVSAVPYALESQHAVTASKASGELEARLQALERRSVATTYLRYGYRECTDLITYHRAGYTHVLVDADIYLDAECKEYAPDKGPAKDRVSRWCAEEYLNIPDGATGSCNGHPKYYTRGIISVLYVRPAEVSAREPPPP